MAQSMSQGRFTLTGTARELPEGEQEAATQLFLQRNPNSFWVHFGDFSMWRLDELVAVRFVLGFARAGQVGRGRRPAAGGQGHPAHADRRLRASPACPGCPACPHGLKMCCVGRLCAVT